MVQPSFLGMKGCDLRLRHYFTPQVNSELLSLLDLVQLGLGVAFLTVLASFETTTISAIMYTCSLVDFVSLRCIEFYTLRV